MKAKIIKEKDKTILEVPEIKDCSECGVPIMEGQPMYLCNKTKEFYHKDCIFENHISSHINSEDIEKYKDILVIPRIVENSQQMSENTK